MQPTTIFKSWRTLPLASTLVAAMLLPFPAIALDEGTCNGYAAKAIEQTNEYHFRKCTKPGRAEWWNTDHAYHFNWCRGLPEGSDLALRGEADRSNVLSSCRDEALERGPTPQHPAALPCPQTLGTLQFGERDLEISYIAPKPPNDGAVMYCNYRTADGVISLYAKWAVPANFLGWEVTGPVQFGCVEGTGRPESYTHERGFSMDSAKFFAQAGLVGSTKATIQLAQQHGFGPVQNFILGAELQARSCLQRGNY